MPQFDRLGNDMSDDVNEAIQYEQDVARRAHYKMIVDGVKKHANDNYLVGGWDIVVECWEDKEIEESVGDCATLADAIRQMADFAAVAHDRRQDQMVEADVGGKDTDDVIGWDRAEVEAQYRDDLTGYEEHLRDSLGCGDARRCPRHPHVITSSDDGLHDADCGQCEYEGEEEYQERLYAEELANMPDFMKCYTLSDIIHCEVGHGGWVMAMLSDTPCPEVSFWGQECDTDPIPF